jgi:hypothetical protein
MKNALAYYKAGAVVVKFEVVGLAPVIDVEIILVPTFKAGGQSSYNAWRPKSDSGSTTPSHNFSVSLKSTTETLKTYLLKPTTHS